MGRLTMIPALLGGTLSGVPAPAAPYTFPLPKPLVEHKTVQCDIAKCSGIPKSWQVDMLKGGARGYNVITSADVNYQFALPIKAHAIGPYSPNTKLCIFTYSQHLDTQVGDLGFSYFTQQITVGYGPKDQYSDGDAKQFADSVDRHLAKDEVPPGLYWSGLIKMDNVLDHAPSGMPGDPACEWQYDPTRPASLSGKLTINYDHVTTLSWRLPGPVPLPK